MTPTTRLTRREAAAALTEAGYPISPRTLADKAIDHLGPPYYRFNGRAIYEWGAVLMWAQARCERSAEVAQLNGTPQ